MNGTFLEAGFVSKRSKTFFLPSGSQVVQRFRSKVSCSISFKLHCKNSGLTHPQPRSYGSLLPVPAERERERRVGERTWERG